MKIVIRLASCLLAFAVLALPMINLRDIQTPVPGLNGVRFRPPP